MDDAKRQRLEAKGWQVGTVTDFLQLMPEEEAIVEFKLALSHRLKEIFRKFRNMKIFVTPRIECQTNPNQTRQIGEEKCTNIRH